jgi:hypothetical protein
MEVLLISLLVFGFPIALIIFGLKRIKTSRVSKKEFQLDYNLQDRISMGTLVSGHPDVNNRITPTVIFSKGNNLEIFHFYEHFGVAPKKIAEIEKDKITNITVEDQSTIEKRITATRLLLVGVFALAWKKKEKNHLAYKTIYWNDGRFDHETIFEFEGIQAMKIANESRNKLLRILK